MDKTAARRLCQDVATRSDILRSPRKFKKKSSNPIGARFFCPICKSLQPVFTASKGAVTLACAHVRQLNIK